MEVTRIFDLLPHYLEQHPDQQTALASKRDGRWQSVSIQQYSEMTNALSYALLRHGIGKGDTVAIICGNRPEWNIIDMAVMQIGAVSVPLYPTITQNDYKYILNHAGIKLMFVEGKNFRSKIEPILHETPVQEVYAFLDTFGRPTFSQLIEEGRAHPAPEQLQALRKSIDKMDMATIIYTSGTTGVPKGVMLSHNNIVQNFYNLRNTPAKWNTKALSFLPLCHAYERMMVYLYQYLGISVYYAESLGTIGDNIKEIMPTFMTCVPRLLEKIYDKLLHAGMKQPFYLRPIYYWAFNLAKKYRIEERTKWYNTCHTVADKLIYSKWREAIGGNFDIVVSGGSAIKPEISAFFSAIGMPVFEGYGMSETSPVIAVMDRLPGGRRFGTVGHVLTGTELRIGTNNEIQCRGHNVMLGYYRNPELTAQVIDKDGWLHTGDTGKLSADGVLTITGRLKTIFKTSLGKYINPQALESKFCESPFIDNIVVLGENQKFAAALIAPDFNFLKAWCKRHHVNYTTPQDIIKNQIVIARFNKELKKYNTLFGDWEQIKRFELVPDEWTQSNVLTPTLKVKRGLVEEMYKERIDKLFA